MEKIKLLYITPHLSTGGMPKFVLKRIQSLQKFKDKLEIFLVEYSQFSDTYVVQRNEIIKILGEDHFFTLGRTDETTRKYELIDIIKNNNIDVIHSEEMLDGFESFNKIPMDLLNQIYSNDRTWRIVETCHNVWYDPKTNKKLQPEAYSLVTPYHMENTFKDVKPMKKVSLYPFENKVKPILKENGIVNGVDRIPLVHKLKMREELGLDLMKTHVLNVGLWTSGKNQGEGVEVARTLVESNPNIQFHFVGNQASNFEEYWGPIMKNLPSNVKVWGERSDVDKFMQACDVLMFNSTWECNPLVVRESVNYGMKILTRNLPQYLDMFEKYITPIEGDVNNISNQLLNLIESGDSYEIPNDESFGEGLLNYYTLVKYLEITQQDPIKNDYVINQHYVCQPFFEIKGQSENIFDIKMFAGEKLVYRNTLPINRWVKLNREYYADWRTEVWENGVLIYNKKINLEGERVYISFGSKSLGDTLAWIPYVEEFRKKHNCNLTVSTFMNELFIDQYPEITFVTPGVPVHNIIAQYRLGWFYNEDGSVNHNMVPNDYKKQPLQKTATDILGLDYVEIRPKLKLPNVSKKKKVGIGFHSTAQAKYWNNPEGWQKVVDYLTSLGYECMIYSKEGDGYMGNSYPNGVTVYKGGNLQEVIDDLSECEFFIGLGSGLSWLAWACELPVVLISGFSEKWAETTLDTYRIINERVCHGCFNSERLDAGDWNWCPLHKNTDRMFECTKKISPDMVIRGINEIIGIPNDSPEIIDLTDDSSDTSEGSVTIVLSHADNEWRKNLLKECIENLRGEVILSSNYPVDSDIQELCDWVLYTKNNPLLMKEDYGKYKISYNYWTLNEAREKVYTPMEYEHGYSVYTLIQNGIRLAKQLGKKKVHIVNYDYIINNETILENDKKLDEVDCVFYTYDDNTYDFNSVCCGFFSGNVDKLDSFYSKFKSKDDYYSSNFSNIKVESILYNFYHTPEFKVYDDKITDLKKSNSVDREGVLMFSKDNGFNKFKHICDKYECDKSSKHSYHNTYAEILRPMLNEEFNLFEIGIVKGNSIKVWEDYLMNAKIYGLDSEQELSQDRVRVFKGDQNNINDLQNVVNTLSDCRIIIDNGSHNPQHQLKSFNFLFKNLLESGGYYVIENVESSYMDPLSSLNGYEIGYLNIVDYFSKINHQLNDNDLVNELGIESIRFSPNLITIKKK
jgi:autotransporter strand-loop-strand O-heptosyltransferase